MVAIVIICAILAYYAFCVVLAIIYQIRQYKPAKRITAPETNIREDDVENVNIVERITIVDETIVKYNRLLDTLERQYKTELDEKKRSIILSKQVATMEKLTRALEKREKLG